MSVESDDAAESSSGASPRNPSRSSRPSNVNKSTNQKTKATHTIDRTQEYEDFIATLRAYHKQRGTSFEPEPWVGSAHLDLLKVFNHVVAAGGYDHVSATTLEWRKLATELGLDVTDRSAAGVAYALKSAFLKYLAAYEILTIHKKEPPPPQILEHESAKGGGLLTRTLENYTPKKGPTTVARAVSVNASASETDDTPARKETPGRKETPRSGGTSRNLRVAPPQRVIFQPDTGTARQTRPAAASSQQSSHSHSATSTPTPQAKMTTQPQGHSHPQPMGMGQQVHASHMGHTVRGPSFNYNPQNPETTSTLVQNFEPRIDMTPIQMRPVETPANNPAEFDRRRQDRLKASGLFSQPQSVRPPPGATVFEGPNIYVRCLCALRSGIPSEQAYALHHLVKISYERGDKFKFENFAGLAEGLVGKGLEVGSKFFHVNWTIDYSGDPDESNLEELDGLNGTPDILERIARLRPKDVLDNIQPADFADDMVQITEAVLTMRNMVTLPENAMQMADFPVLRDLVCIILHLPNMDSVVELKHCALDIAEQLAPYIVLDAEDPLYRTLIAQLHSTDRGAILTALRATTRLSMFLGETNRLPDVPASVLQNILDWLMLNDDELIDACLDFLYVYTAFIANIEPLLKAVGAPHLVNHLVRLLSHGARRIQKDCATEPEKKLPACESPLPIPEDLREQLLQMGEPDRCFAWLKCLFEEDPDSAITQIAIWQAYQASFSLQLQQMSRPMINAAEFIKNVPHVFKEAEPQIVKEMGERGETSKFIIRGVRPRMHPTTTDGREYVPCLWKTPVPVGNGRPGQRAECIRHFKTAEQLYNHIIADHLGEKPGADGKFADKERDLYCTWGNCARFPRLQKMQLSVFMNHIKTHTKAAQQKIALAHALSVEAAVGSKRPRRTYIVPPRTISIQFEETAFLRDERQPPVAAGIPFSAVLVLRNVARNVSKADGLVLDLPDLASEGEGQSASPLEHLFRPVTARLCDIMTKNQLLASYVQQVLEITRDNY